MKQHQSTEPEKALVLGADTRSFLTVVRSLGRKGISVDVAWSHPVTPALRSKYIRRIHQLPTPWTQPSSWIAPLLQLIEHEQYRLVIPCNDPSLIPLQENRQHFETQARVYLLEDRTYDVFFDKSKSTAMAESLDISVPKSVLAERPEELNEIGRQLGYPLVIKAQRSYSPNRLTTRNRVLTVRSELEARLSARSLFTAGPVQVQTYFDGVGVGVEFIAQRGRILLAFQHQRLHEPLAGGGSSYRKSVPLDPRLLQATSKLVMELNYSGVGMVEFRWNPKSDEWIFIEVNGRFWGSLPLAVSCGADFPYYLYRMLVHGESEFPQRYAIGRFQRNWVKDASWMREQINLAPWNPLRWAQVSSAMALGMLRTVVRREHADTLVFDDLRPGISEISDAGRSLFGKVTRFATRRLSSCRWGKSYLRWKIGRILRTASRILFVCKGNICRSPFAERYARQVLSGNFTVGSSGYYPVENRGSPAEAIEAADELNVDLSNHRSRVLQPRDVQEADIIFTFDDENLTTLKSQYPGCSAKLFQLGCLRRRGSNEIIDPFTGSLDKFRSTYQIIKASVDMLDEFTPRRNRNDLQETVEK